MRTSHLISLTAPATAGGVGPNAANPKGWAAIRRVIAVLAVSGVALLGLSAVASPAQGSIAPGTNGKIVFGQIFPNYGVTINPDGSDEHEIGPPETTTCNTWSPDGSKVLCNVWSEDGVQPATANPDGSDFTLLNPNLPLDLFCLSWSPGVADFCATARGRRTRPTPASTRCGHPTRATSSGSARPLPAASTTGTATLPTAHGSCSPASTPTEAAPFLRAARRERRPPVESCGALGD